jgi:PAS domain S-box-containing protein
MLIEIDYFKNIFNTVRDAILILDEDMRVVSANRSFFTIFKVDAANTIGFLLNDLGNGQWDIPNLHVLLEDILPKNDTVVDYEIEHTFENIGRKIMLLNACKIREKEDGLPIILLAFEDITERKRLEDLLIESEERYRRIFETASDGIVLLEKQEGKIAYANQAVEIMTGYPNEECIGKKLQDIGISVEMSDFPAIMQQLNKNGIINYDDVVVKTKTGNHIEADIYMVDRAKLAQCNIRDVSERKRAAETLKEEKKFIENALNSMKDVFFVFDLEGRLIRWNETINTVTGYNDKEIALMKPLELLRNNDAWKISKVIQTAAREGSATVDVLLVTKDGRQISYEFRASRLADNTGKLIGIIGVGSDLTERNKLESQLHHSQKMEAVGTLAGGIAHDFNNILNVILGYGGMIMDTLETGCPSKEHMREVLIAADRAAELTKRLLVFCRKQDVEVKPVNINGLILGLQNMLSRIIIESIEFDLYLADRPLIVLADAGQIEQVLINLATNAKDAMPEGGRLTISTSLEELDEAYVAAYGYGMPGRYALIAVADTGQGMEETTQQKIFEPFFTTKGIGEGTGLGLAICYGIIKQHSGFIKVYSEPGKGTLLKIYLPLGEEAACPDKKTAVAVPVMGGNETVLVAEDNASLRTLTRIVLESFGYRVISAVDGEDAITKFTENSESIGLALLDMIMPKKNGKEVSDAIIKVNPGVKVLFSSGYTMDIIKSEGSSAIDFDFIHKPYPPKDLLIKVREILDR